MQENRPEAAPKKGNRKKKQKQQQQPSTVEIPAQSHPRGYYEHQTGTPGKTAMHGRERAKADALFASTSSHWYAGAAFDRSPAANTLPRPTRLLSKGGGAGSVLATSCPSSSLLEERTALAGARTRDSSPSTQRRDDGGGNEDLQAKSRELLRLLRATPAGAGPAAENPTRPPPKSAAIPTPTPRSEPASPPKEDLEEMTRQVRRLLNMS